MTVKSIIEIDVQDSQFKAFKELFDAYHKKVEGMPDDWKKSKDATDKSGKSFEKLADEAQAVVDHAAELTKKLREAAKAQNQFGTSSRNAGKSLHTMAKDAKDLGKSIFGIGKYLGRMALWGTGIAGAGLFGLDSLARSAVSGQRGARGLGIDQGALRAFGIDYGRYANPGILSSVAESQGDLTKRQYLAMSAGVSYNQAGAMRADDLAIKTIQHLHDWWQKTPAQNRSTNFMQAQGFSQIGISFEDARRIGTATGAELLAAQSQYKADRKSFGVSDQTTSDWYQLSRQMAVAGQSIETNLINKLNGLGRTFGDIIPMMTADFNALVNSISPADIKSFGDSVKSAVQYLSSPAFTDKLKMFGEALNDAALGIIKITELLFGKSPSTPQTTSFKASHPKFKDTGDSFANFAKYLGYKAKDLVIGEKRQTPTFEENAMRKGKLSELDKKYHLPAGTGWGIYTAESNRGMDLNSYKPNAKGAVGPMQFLPKTALQYGVLDRTDFDQSAKGSARYMADLMKHYGGDVKKSDAAYNWGQGKLDADIRSHGAEWMKFAPRETQKYVEKVGGYQMDLNSINKPVQPIQAKPEKQDYGQSRDPLAGYFPKMNATGIPQNNVSVVITNKTGSDMAVSVNALAH